MRKLLLFGTILTIAALAAKAQILPDWTWAKALTGSQGVQVQSVLMDNAGNMYVSATAYIGPLTIDGSTFSADTVPIIFVAKFNTSGALLWKATIKKRDPQYMGQLFPESIMLDKLNNLYFTIGTNGPNGGNDTLYAIINANQQKEFPIIGNGYMEPPKKAIVKLDPDGNIKYIVGLEGYGSVVAKGGYFNLNINGSTADAQGNLFITGSFSLDSLILGNSIIRSSSFYQCSYIAKVDTAGIFTWATVDSTTAPAGGSGSEANSIALDASGNPLIFGDFNTIDRKFGNLTINAPFGVRNLYFLSLDQKDGTPKILTSYGGSVADYAGSITSDETGNYYLTGFTNSASLFGQSASVTQKEETFVASIDSAGQLNWAKIVMTENPGYSPSDPLKLVLGPDKFPVMAGLFQSKTIALDGLHIANHDTSAISRDIFVVRFNPETKLATYLNSFGNMTFDFDLNLYSDIHNMVTTIAEVNDSIFYIGKDTLHFTPYTYGILIAHFDTSGVLLGQKAFMPITGQSFSVITNNVVQSYSGYLGVAGGFSGKTLYLGTKTLTAFNDTLSQNMFIAKMGYSMSGNIFDKSGLTKVTSGYVKLFVLAQSGPAAMADSSLIGETGGYKFTDAPLTGSLVYAVADTNIYPDYVGTYAGNSILWTGAAVLDLVSTPAPTFDITLKQVLPVTGPGEITGTVTETLYDTTSKSLKSTGRPMKGASVVLVGKSNKGSDVIIAMTKTDNNGNYQFTNIPVGDYKVWIDVTGLGMIEYYAVGITDLAPTVENLNYIVAETGIYKDLSLAVRTIRKANDLLFVYPNPASDYIHAIISLNENNSAMIDIYSISGSHVKSIIIQSTTLGNAILNISDLPSGMYILKASVTGKITQYARFIKQ